MKLNISDWESFCASDIFFLYNGSGITKEEIEDNPGSFPAVQSGADNNGCIGYISKDYCKAMNYTFLFHHWLMDTTIYILMLLIRSMAWMQQSVMF